MLDINVGPREVMPWGTMGCGVGEVGSLVGARIGCMGPELEKG